MKKKSTKLIEQASALYDAKCTNLGESMFFYKLLYKIVTAKTDELAEQFSELITKVNKTHTDEDNN